jgi:hypothetical protein
VKISQPLPLLPDDRFFGQITQKSPQKMFRAGKIGGGKIAEIRKNLAEKGWKTFLQLFNGESIYLCVFS